MFPLIYISGGKYGKKFTYFHTELFFLIRENKRVWQQSHFTLLKALMDQEKVMNIELV